MDYRVDEIDRRILYHLVRDARNTSAPTIAEEVDVSPGTIRNRIRQLEDAGIVRGYHADVDYERVEGRLTNIFMCTVPIPERERLAHRALDVHGVVNVRELLAGRRNLHVTAVATDSDDLTRVARELSELGAEIEEENLIQTEHFHPYHEFGPENGRESPSMTDVMALAGDAEVVELTVGRDSPIVGLSLVEADSEGVLGDDVLVVAVERGENMLTPKGDTVIRAGDVVTIFSRNGHPSATIDALTGV